MLLGETLVRLGDRRNQLAAATQDLERALLGFAANEIDHSVGTPDTFLEPPGPVVDDRVRAELANESRIVSRRSGNDMQARLARELDGIGADASGGAMDQDGLPCREPGVLEQGLPSRHGNDGDAGRLDVAERGGLARDHRRRRQGVLRIGADELRVRHAIDLVSHEGARNPWPHGNDFTRQVRAQRQGQRLRQGTFPGPDPAVPWTYSRGLDLYEDLAWTGIGAGICSNFMTSGGPYSCTRQAIIDDEPAGIGRSIRGSLAEMGAAWVVWVMVTNAPNGWIGRAGKLGLGVWLGNSRPRAIRAKLTAFLARSDQRRPKRPR